MKRISGHYLDKNDKQVNFDFEVATSWEELERFQVEIILEILTYKRADRYTVSASLLILLCKMNWLHVASLPDEDIHALVPLTNFLFDTQPPAKNLHPKLTMRKIKYFAPADDLSNIGFGEWCFLAEMLHNYRRSKAGAAATISTGQPILPEAFLDKFIMTMYRPADPDQQPGHVNYTGDIREKFNENLINHRAKLITDMHFKIKETILAWFSAALLNIMASRPHLFPIVENKSDSSAEASAKAEIPFTWFDVFREQLGPKWGTTEELKYTNAIFVLDYLEQQQREQNEN